MHSVRTRALILALCLHGWMSSLPAEENSQDARSIVSRSVSVWNRNDELARDYIYDAFNETRELDSPGHAKSVHSTLEEILFIGGKRYVHPLEKDGKPLTSEEAKHEKAKLDRAAAEASRLSEDERRKRNERAEADRQEQRNRFKDIPDAYDFRLLGEPSIDGRPAYEILASPRREYKGRYRNLLHNLQGKLWIDAADYQWVRVEAEVLQNFSIGWFLARIGKGTQLSFEMTRVNDEIWAPRHVSLTASARLGLVKKINAEQEVTFSNYRKFQTDSRIVSSGDPP